MTTDSHQAQALAWLAGRMHWEQLLSELHAPASATDDPVEAQAPVAARAA